jgi:acetyltransferase-like isoleucine patch superfamily enzyme
MGVCRRLIIKIYWIYNKYKFILAGAKIGKYFRISGHLKLLIGNNSKLIIQDYFTVTSGNFYNPLSRNIKSCIIVEDNATLRIGQNVGISSSCIWIHDFLFIGDNVKIGADTIILDSNAHSLDFNNRRNNQSDALDTRNSGIEIGDDVLVGTRCIILKGVKIGSRSIIGAGSIVTKNIPPDCIAAGNPCKPLNK